MSLQNGERSRHEHRGAFLSCRDRLCPVRAHAPVMPWQTTKVLPMVSGSAGATGAQRPATRPNRAQRAHHRPHRAARSGSLHPPGGDDDPDPEPRRQDREVRP